MTDAIVVTRRSILLGALGGVSLVVGFPLAGRAKPKHSILQAEPFRPNAFLRISPEGQVTAIIPPSEMGQGIHTALAMVLADELDAEWGSVSVEAAPADPAYANPLFHGMQATEASMSTISFYTTMRHAAAAARLMLVTAAAAEWRVPALKCRTVDGVVYGPDGQHRPYGELVATARQLEPPTPTTLQLKDPKDFKFIGRSMPRVEGYKKITGQPIYGLDVELPGMLTAMVARAPMPGARVRSYDRVAARALPGVRTVVEIPSGVAVVAENYWAALRAREQLRVEWDFGSSDLFSSAQLEERYRALARTPGIVATTQGDVVGALRASKSVVSAEYSIPCLTHAAMEPLNCTIDAKPERCDVWVGTQYQSMDRTMVARILGRPQADVYIHTTFMGGGFGRRGSPNVDVVAETAQIVKAARDLAVPIRNVWAREDDIRGGFYRPMALNVLWGSLDESGALQFWKHRIVAQSPLERTEFDFFVTQGIDASSVAGARDFPYAVSHLLVELHTPEFGPTVQWMRAVGNSNTCFAIECFLDELVHRVRLDPVEVRRKLLAGKKGSERLLNVLNVVADKAPWGRPLPPGSAQGVAVHDYWGTKVAQIAEVSVKDNHVHIDRVTCAVDCGTVLNPDGVKAQIEGGIIFALSSALYGEVTFTNGQTDQSNFHDYRILRMDACPRIEVHIVSSHEPPGGVGEVAVPHVAPAVLNAIFAATGQRIRALPLIRNGLSA